MNLINCSKEKYLKALAERKPTKAEDEFMKKAAEAAGFKNLKHGRQIAPSFWLQALRAYMRGHIFLPRLGGCSCLCEASQMKARAEGMKIISELREKCPDFFAGMLVDEDEAHEPRAAAS